MLFSPLGFGVGLRHCHFSTFLRREYTGIDWVEALTENFLPWVDRKPRRPLSTLLKIRQDLPVALHGVSLSIGSASPMNLDYLTRLKELIQLVEPALVSDHLCWTGLGGKNLHDLLPLPYDEKVIKLVVDHVCQVQEFLGRKILLENVSSYVEFKSELTEWEFLSEIARRADCGILLDVNNIYVSGMNHGFNPMDYLKGIPLERVGQVHLAGHSNKGHFLIDTHDHHVCDGVWDLYRWTCSQLGKSSIMIEWDDRIPRWELLEREVHRAREIWNGVLEAQVSFVRGDSGLLASAVHQDG